MQHRIEEVMRHGAIVVDEAATLDEIARLLDHHHISGVPVVDAAGRPVGMISEVDLRKAPRDLDRPAAAALMHSPVITVLPTASVAEAARLMRTHHVNRLPVVDHIDERIIGIVTRADLLAVLYRDDDDIRAEILDDVLLRECVQDPRRFDVQVKDGIVSLRGQVERRSLIPIIVGLVQRMDGVVDVENRLHAEYDDASHDKLGALLRANS